ncbi:MAG: hemerythrin family protein [Magnetococcales bacterium]|nr:hemerythrin family protein [Magnetococcales bacterium]
MSVFEWSDSLSIGIPEVDEQHQGLVDAMKGLEKLVKPEVSGGHLHVLLGLFMMQVSGYVKTHFSFEEMLMAQHNFPGLDKHRKSHRKLEEDFTDFSKRLEQAKDDEQRRALVKTLLTFMHDWFSQHVKRDDMAYGEYLREEGIV